jgi:Fe2+ transport system protein FeoA
MASRSVEMQAAQQTVVLPAMLKPKEERQVQELVSMGFDRGQVLHLSQLNPFSLN